jgi:entericidin B
MLGSEQRGRRERGRITYIECDGPLAPGHEPPNALVFQRIGRYTMFRSIVGILTLLSMLVTIAGCNTIEGMGKDIERGGEATQDTAKDVKNRM